MRCEVRYGEACRVGSRGEVRCDRFSQYSSFRHSSSAVVALRKNSLFDTGLEGEGCGGRCDSLGIQGYIMSCAGTVATDRRGLDGEGGWIGKDESGWLVSWLKGVVPLW